MYVLDCYVKYFRNNLWVSALVRQGRQCGKVLPPRLRVRLCVSCAGWFLYGCSGCA